MQYFTERGDSHAEVLAKVRNKYGSGPDVLISNQREVPVKSVWGKITLRRPFQDVIFIDKTGTKPSTIN